MKEYYNAVMNNNVAKIKLSPERIENLNLQMEQLLLYGVSKIMDGKENLNITVSFYKYNIKKRLFFWKKLLDFSNFATWVEEKQDEIAGMLEYVVFHEEEAADYIKYYQDEDKLAWFCYALLNIGNVTFDKIYNLLHFAAKCHSKEISEQKMKKFFTRHIAFNIYNYPYRNYAPYGMWLLENFDSVPLSLKYRVACAIPNQDDVNVLNLQKRSKSLRFLRAWLIISILFAVYVTYVSVFGPSNDTLSAINLLIAIIFCGISYGLYRKSKR